MPIDKIAGVWRIIKHYATLRVSTRGQFAQFSNQKPQLFCAICFPKKIKKLLTNSKRYGIIIIES